MDPLLAVVFVLYFFLLAIPIYLFFFADRKSNGLNGQVSRFLLEQIPAGGAWFVASMCGDAALKACENTYDWVTNQRNPIMQIAYFALINAAFAGWMVTGAPQLPTYFCSTIHKYAGVVAVLLAEYTYYLACTVGPGTITTQNVACFNHQPYDGLMYAPGARCSTCSLSKVCTVCEFPQNTR
jgi:hypothetical protein